MRTKIKNFWLGLLMLTMVLQPVFVTAGIPEAITYLQAQPQDAWITMALAAAEQTSIPTSHLTSVSGNLATDYAKTILALAAVNENPATFGSIDYVAQLKTYHNNNQMGSIDLLNDDMWSILALASVGEVGSIEAIDAKNYVLAQQNPDGGWGYAVSGDSDTNDTAAAIMALVEAGIATDDPVITNALAYIQSGQNSDGGIGYQIGNDSDSGSDSWVISALYKVGIDPTSWDQQGNNPITHLESLQDTDGGFWWLGDGSAWDNKAMTPHAVIALSGKSHPVGYYQVQQPGEYHLRIEGSSSTICDTYVAGTTAMDVVENAALICSYTYTIIDTEYGPYLSEINGEAAEGVSGWLYFVNYISPPFGAADYILAEDDEILWYYGEWGWGPTKVTVDSIEIDPGETVNVIAEYFNGTEWLPLPNANIKVNNNEETADASGQLTLTFNENGAYYIYVDMAEFVRSEKVIVTVGDTVSQTISLQVEIEQIQGEIIALIVSPDHVDFGILSPEESATQTVLLLNDGTVGLGVAASISGDSIFTSGIKIDDSSYSAYLENLDPAESVSPVVSLTVPEDYLESGIKTGELIFWGTAL